jgi:hypothetical protein
MDMSEVCSQDGISNFPFPNRLGERGSRELRLPERLGLFCHPTNSSNSEYAALMIVLPF